MTVGELSRSEGVSLQPGERDGTREENIVTETTGTNLRVLFEVETANETRRAGDDNVHSRRESRRRRHRGGGGRGPSVVERGYRGDV